MDDAETCKEVSGLGRGIHNYSELKANKYNFHRALWQKLKIPYKACSPKRHQVLLSAISM